jgi:sugar (pentulose or hexulose) kinase
MMGTKSGTSSIDFFKGLLCPGDDMKKLDAEIDRIPVGSSGIVIHPYLAGERAPFNSPYAFSSIMGMCSGHSRYEIMRAAYEGLAMSFLDSYKSLPAIEMLYLTGGASKSPIVCRMYCDVIGLPIKRQAAAELGTLGIAKMLAVTLGFADSFEKLGSNTFTEYEPDMKKHEQYLELYSKFVSYRNSMEKHWKNE